MGFLSIFACEVLKKEDTKRWIEKKINECFIN